MNIFLFAQTKVDNSLTKLPETSADADKIATVMTVVFGVAGAIAVLVIVLAGFTMITGGDNPEKISTAKNAIIYSLVGLLVIILAESIVMVVLGQF